MAKSRGTRTRIADLTHFRDLRENNQGPGGVDMEDFNKWGLRRRAGAPWAFTQSFVSSFRNTSRLKRIQCMTLIL